MFDFRLAPTLVSLVLIAACSNESPAQDATATSDGVVSVAASKAPATPVKGSRMEKKYIDSVETGLKTQMLLFSRTSPEVAANMKTVSLDVEDRKVIRCSIDGLKKAGLSEYLQLGIDMSDQLNKAVMDNPDLSMRTMDQYPEVMSLMTGETVLNNMSESDQETSAAITKSCGMMGMMMKKMNESGVMAAIRTVNID